jgi:hypothetical protein
MSQDNQAKKPRRYLDADEILNLVQNTNKSFPTKQPPLECPIKKTEEEALNV